MKRDTTLFSQDFKVDLSGEEIPFDTSHIYTGEIYGNVVHLILLHLFECIAAVLLDLASILTFAL